MRANFELRYGAGRNTNIQVDVDTEVNSDEDKRHFLKAIAQLLDMEIEVPKTHAERVFEAGDEAHE